MYEFYILETKLQRVSVSPEGLLKADCWAPAPEFQFSRFRVGTQIHISNKFSGDGGTDATDLQKHSCR